MALKTVRFPSKDGLPITADLYSVPKSKGFLLLCHRSHFNRGEYREAAAQLNTLGFSCMAIDQRSGMNVLGTRNETATRAKQKGLPTGYREAQPDIEAAIDYAYAKNHGTPIILVGSSYSASLALMIAAETMKVKAVVAFSPGEYLKGIKVAESAGGLKKPVYVTSARKEIKQTSTLIRYIGRKYLTQFKPKTEGAHGSRVLWEKTAGHEEYWRSFGTFLSKLRGSGR